MALSNSKTLKTSVLSVTALAASSAWGKSGFGDNGPKLGQDYLTLQQLPVKNATLCFPADDPTKQFGGLGSDKPSIVVDSSKNSAVKVSFIVSKMIAKDEDRVLYLVYSTKTTPSPSIITTDKGPKLGLAMSELEILGYYQIPALYMGEQFETKVGMADAEPATEITVNVEFDQSKIDKLIRQGNETIYVQAGLIRITDLNRGNMGDMILSEMDSLTFVPNKCPADTVEFYEADEQGNIGKTSI